MISRKNLFGIFSYSAVICAALFSANNLSAQTTAFAERIQKVLDRPEFAHSSFGMEFYSLDSGKTIFSLNPARLMVPGSTTKLLTEGSALELLGSDYRFHTFIYRTGPIKKDGTLDGDLVLVASGDANLSNRIQPDGTLAFENEDHSYGGDESKGFPRDPLLVIREFAQQIAAKGIKRINGHVLVDTSLFPEGDHELGTGVVISPIVVNDNLVDVIISPGDSEGAPLTLRISPNTSYVNIINQATTGKANSKDTINYVDEKANADGTRSVTLTGSVPLSSLPQMGAYPVPEPSRYAATLLVEALREKGVTAKLLPGGEKVDFKSVSSSYKPENAVAEHVSPPLREDVKITLKVSQNLHASMTPFVLGALLGKEEKPLDQAGFNAEHDFLKNAGLDLTAAAQS